MNQTQKTDGVKQAPLYEAVARDIAKEIDRQILGGDPDNKPGEHYYDIMTMTRIASEYTYALEQEYQMSITQAIATATQQAVELERERILTLSQSKRPETSWQRWLVEALSQK